LSIAAYKKVLKISDKKFVKDVLIIAGSQVIIGLGSFLILPLISKTLGPYSYGIWSLISTTISLLTSLALLGLSESMVRFLAAEKDPVKIKQGFFSILFFVISLGLVISVAVFFLSDVIALTLFNDISVSYLIKAASFLILFNAIVVLSLYYFRIFQQTVKFSIFMIIQTLSQLFLMYILISFGFGILGVIIGYLLVQIFIFFISIFFVIKEIGFVIPDFSVLPTYLRFGLPIAPSNMIEWLKNSNSVYIITFFLGIQYLGIYSAAYAIGSFIAVLAAPIQFILFPLLSQLFDENKLDQVSYVLKDSVKYFTFLAIPAAFGLSFLAVPLLNIITTPEFSSAAILIPFFAFGGVFLGINTIWTNIINLVKKTHITLYLLVFSAILSISLNFLLVPLIGILGGAISAFLSYLILMGLTFLVSFKYINITVDYKFLIKSIAASFLMGIALVLLHPVSLLQIISSVFFGIFIYFLLMIIFKGIRKEEYKIAGDILLEFLGRGEKHD
jgi:O-antigen/teichoic acid export membrane protein